MLGVGDTKSSPDLRCLGVEAKYVVPVLIKHREQPNLQQLGLRMVSAMTRASLTTLV
jgi:hypothetical protein